MDSSKVKRVLVVGAGVMGHSIAQVFAQAGIEVRLVDVKSEILDRAMDRIRSNLGTLAEFGRVRKDEIDAILSRIRPSAELPATGKEIDFALEAVVEVPEVKRRLFSRLDEIFPEDTVIASNTSSLDIFSIAEIKRPERLVVAHWFAPPHIIPLVEVVPGPNTKPEVVPFTAALMERIGKRPMIMKTFVPSFIVNRVQNAISRTVWEMLENGWASPDEIDLAVKLVLGIRLPIVGVVQTSDFTGLDLVYDIMKAQDRLNPLIEEKVKAGHLGAKTSRGIYDYEGRSENEILRKRDERYLKMLEHLERIKAFEPI
jgi:3-hydroxybutyryl-CoA dehydrogenase